MSEIEILRLPATMSAFGYRSHASIYCCVKDGLLTKPINIGARSVGWPRGEVQAVLEARIAGCSDEQIRGLVDRLHTQRQERVAALGVAA